MHEQFLLAALEQAWLGRGICAPNPSVGAVAVRNGTIIAQAFHHGVGSAHAEQLLISKLPSDLSGVTLYVTLEPCNHWGRTPPCVDHIIQYGFKEVVFGYRDPNPIVVQNNSVAILKKAGIAVNHVSLKYIDAFYQSYHYWTTTNKPRVTVKLAQTLDGKIGSKEGQRILLSNSLCAEFTHTMRKHADIILTTAKTINADNPSLNVRLDGKEESKPIAIIDSHASINRESHIFNKAQHCHVFHAASVTPDYPKSSYHVMPILEDGMDLEAVLDHLGALGYHDVFVEAGGALFRSLHKKNLVHRTFLYIVPKVFGAEGVSAYEDGGLLSAKHSVIWEAMGDNMIACINWEHDTVDTCHNLSNKSINLDPTSESGYEEV